MGDRLNERHDRPDQHDEHHRVLHLDPGVELPERVERGATKDLAIEQAPPMAHTARRGSPLAVVAHDHCEVVNARHLEEPPMR